ncbi:MAG TPA: universal stress protein [Gemmatimonadales bacterium]|nr:universal stress protein [Gemmatimonadales bacterium]
MPERSGRKWVRQQSVRVNLALLITAVRENRQAICKAPRMVINSFPFRSILVPLDGSALAEQATPLACHIAQRSGGKLRLALVHQPPTPPLDVAVAELFTSLELTTRKSERGYLRAMQGRLRESGTRLSSAVTLTGAAGPGPALAQYIREMGIDLVVMATHGRGGIRRAWLGSVADYLIRNLAVPVLLVRPEENGRASDRAARAGGILVPLDGSPLAEEALDPAGALARVFDAELTLVQMVRPVLLATSSAFPYPSSYDEELTELCRAQAQDYLDDVVEQMQSRGIRASGAARVAWTAADAILDLARPERVALVALATHGRGGVRRLVLGSVADKVVRGADVPVLVYHPTGRGKRSRTSRRIRSGRSRSTQESRR